MSFQPKTVSLFPVIADEPLQRPLQVNGLSDYIRNFNKTNLYKLHIWSRIKGSTTFSNPVVVRFTIPDVLTAFITLSYSDNHPALITQTVTAFGPRERVGFGLEQLFNPTHTQNSSLEIPAFAVRLPRVPEPLATDRKNGTIAPARIFSKPHGMESIADAKHHILITFYGAESP